MLKSYKYRIYPTDKQKELIDNTIDVCRFIYNAGLETKICAYESAGIQLGAFDLNRQLTEVRKIYWIGVVAVAYMQYEMRKVERSFLNFFSGAGFPKFRSKKHCGSFSSPSGVRIDTENSVLNIPKIKNIKIKLDRKIDCVIKLVTISRTATGKYFASILVDNGVELPTPKEICPETTIGIDTGIKNFITTSDGKVFESIRPLTDNLKRLRLLNKRASRKQIGSNNRKKANKKVALCHEKIANIRKDYIHKVTHALTHDSQVESIVIEDLNIAVMMKNKNLHQSLTDVSLGEFYRQLKYKCEWNGINLIKIGRFEPSSKLCSVCNHKNDNLKLSDRIWTCGECGTTHDRDFNAAVNIKAIGLKKQTGAGSSVEPVESPITYIGAMKQEFLIKN